MLSLSLTLSLTSIASHHYQHTHQNFTPMQTPPCLTTETACRFHRPAVTHRRGKYEAFVTAQRDRRTRNESRSQVQISTAHTEQEQALQPLDIEGRLGPEKNNSDFPLTCKWRPSPCRSKMAVHKSESTTKQLKTRGDTPSLLGLSSLIFSEILSRRLVLQHPCPPTSVLNSFTPGRVRNDFVFSNFSHGMRNNDWYRGRTNGSYICVA